MSSAERSAATRLDADTRRAELVSLAGELFGTYGYEPLSMSRIARAAKISKPLLYHYFPSKQALFAASLGQTAQELAATLAPDPERTPTDQLAAGLLGLLEWVAARPREASALLRSLAHDEVRELVEEVRAGIADRILEGLGPEGGNELPAVQLAVHTWLWSVEGASLTWIERGMPIAPGELQSVLLGALGGSLMGAGGA